MLLPGFWKFAQHLPFFQSLLPLPVCNWNPSSCCPGGESQSGWDCIHLSPCGPLKQTLLRNWQFLPLPQPPLVFTARSYGALSPGVGTLGCMIWPGAGITGSQGVPPDIYPPGLPILPLPPPLHATPCLLASLPISTSLPLHQMNVASLNPWLSDFHTAHFFDSSRCYLF